MRNLVGVPTLALACVVAALGCGRAPPTETDERTEVEFVPLVPLANEEYQIVKMAAAHGALTVEVEVAAGGDADAIARELIAPVQSRYVEILVYFYDRDGDSALPLRRVRWTPRGGYEVQAYQTPQPLGGGGDDG
jgi:hypothetical protein